MEKEVVDSSEQKSISNCICDRSERTVKCLTCGATFLGHAALTCNEHPRRINLMDIRLCPNTSCRSSHLMEFENADAQNRDSEHRKIILPLDYFTTLVIGMINTINNSDITCREQLSLPRGFILVNTSPNFPNMLEALENSIPHASVPPSHCNTARDV
ncbi:hypothetical protein LOAG_09404 [Loa loa]|uniref:Uncharacterized protein n=1 Tax=Loa loa TaxID=7209 RepID=A0A1S0TRZ4_LOALO|nr:hypothetical protein LOAG_09404 [Loa loa]EFO19091.1 hypothetical protein LOAG_09404 [Loa loa]